MTSSKKGWVIGVIAGVIIVAMVIVASLVKQGQPTDTTNIVADNTNMMPASMPGGNTKPTMYKNGTYTANGQYFAPSGPEMIGVSVTLKDGIITASSVTVGSQHPTAVQFQEMFASGYKAYVIGKNIDNVHLTRVSGSSLTPNGFNDALATIKTEAAI